MKLRTLPLVFAGLILSSQMSAGQVHPSQDLVEQGIQAFKAGDFRHAEQFFSGAVKASPSARNFNYLGMAEWSAGDTGEAIQNFRQSIRLGNSSATVHYNLGLAYLKQHQFDPGIRETKRAINVDPKLTEARYTLAVALLETGHPAEAIPYLKTLSEDSTCDMAVWANLARAQFESGDVTSALETVDRASSAMPTRTPLIVTLGELCLRYHQFQKARYLLENAVEMQPAESDLKLLLAKTSLEAKEPVETLAVLKDIPESNSGGDVHYMRGMAYGLLGKAGDAEAELSKAVSANPQNIDYLIGQAWSYQIEGNQSAALATLAKAKQLDSRTPVVWYRIAVSYYYTGQYAQVEKYCGEAIHLAPKYDRPYFLKGIASLEEDNYAAAVALIQEAVALNPNDAIYHRDLGVTLFKKHDLAASKNELDRALALDPRAAQTYYWRAVLLSAQGESQRAIADYQTALALQPDISDAYAQLAQLYIKEGQNQKADEMLAKQKHVQASHNSEDERRSLTELGDPL